MANKQTLFCGTNAEFLSAELVKEANEANSGVAFRIPSLVNAGGTLIAAVDKAHVPTDWGFIELAVRTSTDGGKTWTGIKTIATPPARVINSNKENTATAFYIDPCMAVAPNGDVVLLVTYYPESKGLFDKKMMDTKKVAYASFDGKTVPLIYDKDGNFYYVLESGKVLDKTKSATPYKVNFTDGELFENDKYAGNIFLNGANKKADGGDGTTFGASLKAVKRNYVFMLRSTDKGETWSKPVDITGSILNQEKDGYFLGIAPGNAITTKSGRMIFPLYTLKG
ncbi:MAG: sialidase family protein, partial [Erysipelotrichia bacterium]|nr:sialidase family protein [Erysipelotrichia bacterium]